MHFHFTDLFGLASATFIFQNPKSMAPPLGVPCNAGDPPMTQTIKGGKGIVNLSGLGMDTDPVKNVRHVHLFFA